MKQATLENIKGRDLPDQWAKRLGVRPDELVNVTIEPVAIKKVGKKFDRKAIEKIVEEVAKLPVLDDRTADEILGYDENGLPT
ncbi:MAG: hypothetical protein L3J67_13970 [Hyphomicrobiaceae bacterium]|nr:hypothetical protein [Hyphomicrobiaceae bacterium]